MKTYMEINYGGLSTKGGYYCLQCRKNIIDSSSNICPTCGAPLLSPSTTDSVIDLKDIVGLDRLSQSLQEKIYSPYTGIVGAKAFTEAMIEGDVRFCSEGLGYPRILFTSFYMIVAHCEAMHSDGSEIEGKTIYSKAVGRAITTTPKKWAYGCVQYKDIEWFEIVSSGAPVVNSKSKTIVEKKGEGYVALGAALGGAIAGPTGAIVGAIANQGKTVTRTNSSYLRKQSYDFVFKIRNDNDHIFKVEDFWGPSYGNVNVGNTYYESYNNRIVSTDRQFRTSSQAITPEDVTAFFKGLFEMAQQYDSNRAEFLEQRRAGLRAEKNKAPAQSQGCYVATCVYGSYDCPQVWTLRRYRDFKLAETHLGRMFIKAYYAISPKLVKWFGSSNWFKRMWQGSLDRLVAKCKAKGFEDTPYEDKIW